MDKEWYKIVVLGSKSVGKSSFILRKQCNVFTETLNTKTIAKDFVETTHRYRDATVNLKLYESKNQYAGGENRMFFLDAEGAIVLYSCKRAETYREIANVIGQIKANFQNGKSIPIVICATHSDVTYEDREIELSKVEKLYRGMPEIYGCVETSAKTGEGIEEAISLIVQGIVRRDKPLQPDRPITPEPIPWLCSCCFFY